MAWWRKLKCNDCNHEWEQLFDRKNSAIECPNCVAQNGEVTGAFETKPFAIGGSKLSKGVDLAWKEMQKMGYTDMKDNTRQGDTVVPYTPPPRVDNLPSNPVTQYMQQQGSGFYRPNNQKDFAANMDAANALRDSVGAPDPIAKIKEMSVHSDPLKSGPRIVA